MNRLATALAAALPVPATAAAISVQPIQVCDDLAIDCARVETFPDYTNRIYAQRGDTVEFLPLRQLLSSEYLHLDTLAEADALIASTTGTGRSDGAFDVWFVKTIDGGTRGGRAAIGGDGVVIADAAAALGRVDTVAHELAHNLGFEHTPTDILDAERFLLAPGPIRRIPERLADIAPDGLQLARFIPIFPRILVDTVGSSSFAGNGFFHVRYLTGAASDLFLHQLTVDLGPARAFVDPTDSPPGETGSPFGLSALVGIAEGDIAVSGMFDGSTIFTLAFAPGSFSANESFSFGVDIDRFEDIDGFGAAPHHIREAVVTFEFTNGYRISDVLDDLTATSVFVPAAHYERPALVFADPDPLPGTAPASAVPLPGGLFLALTAVGGLGIASRRG